MSIFSKAIVLLKKIEDRKKLQNFRSQLALFTKQNQKDDRLKMGHPAPYLDEATTETVFDAHYIYHPAWATRIVKKINPVKHIDISSTLHFCSTLSAFIPVDFYDYRPANLSLSDLFCGSADLTMLPFESNSIESISCMHTIEHIGLGRYGDSIDAAGDIKAIKELQRVTAINGNLLLAFPMGRPQVVFNAQRIYSFELIDTLFKDFELKDFSLITDDRKFINNADPSLVQMQNCGCGCFWFVKR